MKIKQKIYKSYLQAARAVEMGRTVELSWAPLRGQNDLLDVIRSPLLLPGGGKPIACFYQPVPQQPHSTEEYDAGNQQENPIKEQWT